MTDNRPIRANSIAFEYVYVANQRCDCGGRYETVSQALHSEPNSGPVDRLTARCEQCQTELCFDFDISSFFGEIEGFDRFRQVDAHFRQAMDHVRAHAWDEAQEELLRVVDPEEGEPAFAWGHYHLGMVLLMQQQVDAAVTHLQIAVEIQPLDPDIQDGLGRAYHAAGKEIEAQEQIRKRDALLERFGTEE